MKRDGVIQRTHPSDHFLPRVAHRMSLRSHRGRRTSGRTGRRCLLVTIISLDSNRSGFDGQEGSENIRIQSTDDPEQICGSECANRYFWNSDSHIKADDTYYVRLIYADGAVRRDHILW